MTVSTTPVLGLPLQQTGDNPTTWGQRFNSDNIERLSEALTGTLTVAVGSTIIDPESAAGDISRRTAAIRASNSSPDANVTAVLPSRMFRRMYAMLNTRPFNVPSTRFNLRGPAGQGVSIPNNSAVLAFYDPEIDDVRPISFGDDYITVAGGTIQIRDVALNVSRFTAWHRQGRLVNIRFQDYAGVYPDEDYAFVGVNPLPPEIVPSAPRSVVITYTDAVSPPAEVARQARLIIPASATDPWVIERLDGVPHFIGFRRIYNMTVSYLI